MRALILTLLVFLTPALAKAGLEQKFTSQFGPQTFSLGTQIGGFTSSNISSTLNWNAGLGLDFQMPQFDPNLGLLEDVRINFVGASGLTADILFSNNQLAPFNTAGINVNMTTSISLQDATGSATSADTNFLNNTTTATSSATPFNFGVGSGTLTGASASVPSTMHAAYIGTGFVTLPMSVQFIAEATTSNGAFAVTPFPVLSLSEVSITYEFTPTAVPEPSSLAFGLMPLLGCCVRRKRRNSVKS